MFKMSLTLVSNMYKNPYNWTCKHENWPFILKHLRNGNGIECRYQIIHPRQWVKSSLNSNFLFYTKKDINITKTQPIQRRDICQYRQLEKIPNRWDRKVIYCDN